MRCCIFVFKTAMCMGRYKGQFDKHPEWFSLLHKPQVAGCSNTVPFDLATFLAEGLLPLNPTVF